MDKIKKPKWWDEFTAFAIKGNAMALAVGTIIGAAFSTITKSLTDDIIMPIVSIFIGGVDFSEMKLELPRLFADAFSRELSSCQLVVSDPDTGETYLANFDLTESDKLLYDTQELYVYHLSESTGLTSIQVAITCLLYTSDAADD